MKKKCNYNFKDLTGRIFWYLTVLGEAGRDKQRFVLWLCRCRCGTPCTVRSADLRNGSSKSCGCFQRERTSESNYSHGCSRNGKLSPEYRSWRSMKSRAENRDGTHPVYANVKVCKRWMDKKNGFINFLADKGPRPSKRHSISRFGDVGDYKPSNTAWHTWKQQRAEQKKKRALLNAA